MIDKDPFGYPLSTYLSVLAVAAAGSFVRHLNSMRKFEIGPTLISLVTGSFTGLVMFWLCTSINVSGGLLAVSIAMAGIMGSRLWLDLENFLRIRVFGLKAVSVDELALPMQYQQQPIVPESTSATEGAPNA